MSTVLNLETISNNRKDNNQMAFGAAGQELVWNLTDSHPNVRHLLQAQKGDAAYFVDYKPPTRDAIALPRHVLYVLAGVLLIVVATYAIVSHLINDLIHDLADWILGPKAVPEDAERCSGRGDDEDDDDEEEEEEEEEEVAGRRMSEGVQFKKEGVGLLPGVQRCSSVSYPCTKHPGSRVGFTNQQRGSRSSTQAISIPIPYVTSL